MKYNVKTQELEGSPEEIKAFLRGTAAPSKQKAPAERQKRKYVRHTEKVAVQLPKRKYTKHTKNAVLPAQTARIRSKWTRQELATLKQAVKAANAVGKAVDYGALSKQLGKPASSIACKRCRLGIKVCRGSKNRARHPKAAKIKQVVPVVQPVVVSSKASRGGKYVRWTAEEDAIIIKEYGKPLTEPIDWGTLLGHLNRTKAQVQARANMLGVANKTRVRTGKKRSRNPYTDYISTRCKELIRGGKTFKDAMQLARQEWKAAKAASTPFIPFPQFTTVTQFITILQDITKNVIRGHGKMIYKQDGYALGLETYGGWKAFADEFIMKSPQVAKHFHVSNKFKLVKNDEMRTEIAYQ